MAKTIVVEREYKKLKKLMGAVAGNVLTAIKQTMAEVELPNDNEEVNLNYNNGCKYADLDCARAMPEEALDEDD